MPGARGCAVYAPPYGYAPRYAYAQPYAYAPYGYGTPYGYGGGGVEFSFHDRGYDHDRGWRRHW